MALFAFLFSTNMDSLAIIQESDGKVVTFVRADQQQDWKPPAGTRAIPADQLADGWEMFQEDAPVPTMSASEWVDAQQFSGNRTTTLLYLKLQLDAAGKTSPKLAAVQAWLDALIAAGVTQPEERRSDWPASPHSFEEASSQALAALQ
jgi:hypothetical protein